MTIKNDKIENNQNLQQPVLTPAFTDAVYWKKIWDSRDIPFHKFDRHP
jgi:hypothetical protein